MSTFSKLSSIAQYDDMSRLIMRSIEDGFEEEELMIPLFRNLSKKWNSIVAAHEKEKDDLRIELKMGISGLQKEVKKLSRQLAESRTALVRESNEKKALIKENKGFMERMRQVRSLVENDDPSDAHRRRVIKCLDVERLSPIQSDASDDSDNCLDLDYDKTEEDIMDTIRPQRRSGYKERNAFNEVLESIPPTEQPTILCRYLDRKESEEDEQQPGQNRRKSRRTMQQVLGQGSESKSRSASQVRNTRSTQPINDNTQQHHHHRPPIHQIETESESNGMETDDNDIERCREQLKLAEKEKRDRIQSASSTPNVKKSNSRAATLNAKSTASLMKINSALNQNAPSTPSVMKPHTFSNKKSFKPDSCGPCGGKISFYGNVVKCEVCGVISHPECKDKCPLPCVKITAPVTRSRQKKILISDYVNNDSVPKVPAIIVHCCNEIERGDRIRTPGLYRVVEDGKQIEELLLKILKSKSGMPNLQNVDVHVLTGVVKRFLQKLDETLITTTLWSYFAEATKLSTVDETKMHLEYYITQDLPTANRETLAYLMQHFHAIAKNSDQNNMTLRDLAKALAPTIVGNSCRNPPHSTLMLENTAQFQIMETLFKFDEEFWQQFVQKISSTNNAENKQSSLGARLLGTPTSSSGTRTRSSRLGTTLPTPKLKPLFSG